MILMISPHFSPQRYARPWHPTSRPAGLFAMNGTFAAVTRFDTGCARGVAEHFWSITMKLVAIFAAAIALVAATSACNTIEGIGQDIESVGETVAEEAR